MKLILVRHGQTNSNLAGALDTAVPGAELNMEGQQQAEILAEAWEVLGLTAPDLVIHSNLKRTRQTIFPLLQRWGMEATEHSGIREISAGDLEMATDQESVATYMFTIGAWMQGDLQQRMPGGETGVEVLERFDSAVAAAVENVGTDGTVVLVAHGAIIRFWTFMRAEGVSFPLAATCPVPNACTTVLAGIPGRFKAITWANKPISEWHPPSEATVLATSKEAWLNGLHHQ